MRLGFIDGVEIMAVSTDEPWTLAVDTIVVPAESTFSGLAKSMITKLGLDERRIEQTIAQMVDEPVSIKLMDAGGKVHRTMLFVADAGLNADGSLTDKAIQSALATAASMSIQSLAMPVGLGRHFGIDLLRAVGGHIHATSNAYFTRLNRIVLFGGGSDMAQSMGNDWLDYLDEKPAGAHEVPRESTLLGGVSSDLVPADKVIDSGQDELAVTTYSTMLASMIAGNDTPLPLSVGVFGEWGAGKSYFMGLVRDGVNRLSATPGYCNRTVQIGFNAWHYADTDLWASLGDVIFRELERAVTATSDSIRSDIEQQLINKISHRTELESTAKAAAETASKLQAEIDEAAEQHLATTRDLLMAIRSSPRTRAQFDDTWRELGVRDEADQVRLLSTELRQTATDVTTLRGLTRDRIGRLALGGAVGMVALTAILAVAVPLASVVTGATAIASGIWGGYILTRARAGFGRLRELSTELRAGIATAADQRLQHTVKDTVDRLRKVEFDQRVAEKQLADVVDDVAELSAQLTDLDPERRMSAFLADRAHGDRYTRGLGTVSTVRRDFEELVRLLAQWRDQPDDHRVHPIDRVVLYIDDLDRCGPREVVRVLEAVHLMLALDLFVVVIGVDPRWLLRSLASHYTDVLDDRTLDQWRVAPEDYLEKIINIPFSLPAMSKYSIGKLLRSTLSLPPVGPAQRVYAQQHTNVRRGDDNLSDPPELSITIQPGADLDLETPPGLHPLTEREMTFLGHVGGLVRTPRAAKRLFNLYRMIRATRALSEPASFLGTEADPGAFRIVIILLAVLAAAPRKAGDVFCALRDAEDNAPWATFVSDLSQLRDNDMWTRLCRDLSAIRPQPALPTVQDFRSWLPAVRRFSYLVDDALAH
ncbi:P-loop NTPase fold protein [Amycolatopsis sp. CA-126428]|uniref:P-loop NTPase fold protein n=1 Tax=Amycolatopsis sp. CA-126428 TaxID=2073158 RepID=UPI000CD17ECB|nr:P-loop NTPase fold protein [Amycolatopsis sp. CA-126428]